MAKATGMSQPTEMAGWMAAVALEIGSRQLAAKGGRRLDHVLAAWDVAGSGIARIGGRGRARPSSRRPPEV